jgi:hypothetical protein
VEGEAGVRMMILTIQSVLVTRNNLMSRTMADMVKAITILKEVVEIALLWDAGAVLKDEGGLAGEGGDSLEGDTLLLITTKAETITPRKKLQQYLNHHSLLTPSDTRTLDVADEDDLVAEGVGVGGALTEEERGEQKLQRLSKPRLGLDLVRWMKGCLRQGRRGV